MIAGVTITELEYHRDRVLAAAPADMLSRSLKIGLYGTGFLGRWAVEFLRERGIEPSACFDGNADRHGQYFCDLPISPPRELASKDLDLILITARHVVTQLEPVIAASGVPCCSMDAWYVASHFDAFLEVYAQLADERSRQTLSVVMMAMLSGDHAPLGGVLERDQYFCLPKFAGATKEIYVDAGAYVGDSVERFIWASDGVFQNIHAFEPSPRQFTALEKRASRLREEWALEEGSIQLNRAGLADLTARMSIETASGQLQSMSLRHSSDGDIGTVSLDEYLAGAPATFIKADVEGMEIALLAGAEKTIVTCQPKLAICVYHYPSDVPAIAGYIRSLVPEYKFALRHHSPQLMETVLYCWVD